MAKFSTNRAITHRISKLTKTVHVDTQRLRVKTFLALNRAESKPISIEKAKERCLN